MLSEKPTAWIPTTQLIQLPLFCYYSLTHLTGQPALEDNDSHVYERLSQKCKESVLHIWVKAAHDLKDNMFTRVFRPYIAKVWAVITDSAQSVSSIRAKLGVHTTRKINLTCFTWSSHPPVHTHIHTYTHTVLLKYIFISHCSPGLGLESESGNLLLTPPSPLQPPTTSSRVYKYTSLWVFSRVTSSNRHCWRESVTVTVSKI